MIKVIMFDLDGTLLPMDQDKFVKVYFYGLGKKLEPLGYDVKKVADAVLSGVIAMTKNDGEQTNEVTFWNKFAEILGDGVRQHTELFEDYYNNEFQKSEGSLWFFKSGKRSDFDCKRKGTSSCFSDKPNVSKDCNRKQNEMGWVGARRF